MTRTENTIENKAVFFAHYSCATVRFGDKEERLLGIIFDEMNTTFVVTRNRGLRDMEYFMDFPNCALQLSHVNDISPRNAKEVALIAGYSSNRKDISQIGRTIARNLSGLWGHQQRYTNSWFILDYLRSEGYAVPYRELSIADLISFGWVILKGGEEQ